MDMDKLASMMENMQAQLAAMQESNERLQRENAELQARFAGNLVEICSESKLSGPNCPEEPDQAADLAAEEPDQAADLAVARREDLLHNVETPTRELVPYDAREGRRVYWQMLEECAAGHVPQDAAADLAALAFTKHANGSRLIITGRSCGQVFEYLKTGNGLEPSTRKVTEVRIADGRLTVPEGINEEALKRAYPKLLQKMKKTPAFKVFEDSEWRRQAQSAGFYPHGAPADVFNTYNGLAITREEALEQGNPDSEAAKAFVHHVRHRLCAGDQEEHFRRVMSWLANLVQRPGRKAQWALVLRGARGAGKGIMYSLLEQIIGKRYCCKPGSKSQVLGRFNASMENCLLLNLDELVWGGDVEETQALKRLVTEERIGIERKGVDAYSAELYFSTLITTNESWCAPGGPQLRRFLVLDVDDELALDKALGREVGKLLHDNVHDIAAYLHQYDLDRELLFHGAYTAALEEQTERSMKGVHRWIMELLESKDAAWGTTVPKAAFLQRFHTSGIPGAQHIASSVVMRDFYKVIPKEHIGRKRLGAGGKDGEELTLPPYETALKFFREHFTLPNFGKDGATIASSDPDRTPQNPDANFGRAEIVRSGVAFASEGVIVQAESETPVEMEMEIVRANYRPSHSECTPVSEDELIAQLL